MIEIRFDSSTAVSNIMNAGDGNDRIRNLDGADNDILNDESGNDTSALQTLQSFKV